MTFDKLFKGSAGNRFLMITAGSVIYGASLGLLLAPHTITPGGISGISIMLSSFLPLGVGSLTMLINLPLLIIAIAKWGWRFLFATVFSIAVLGISADIFSLFPPLTDNALLAAVFGGIVMGTGCGIVFRSGSTTGGTDIITGLLKKRYPYLKMGTIILIIDGFISILSGFVYRDAEKAMYSLIALAASTKMIDLILYGGDSAKLIFVISAKSREITQQLIHKSGVGCTVLKGVSGYLGSDTEIVMCAMKKYLLPQVRDKILGIDGRAFLVVANASEVFGEGFKTKLYEIFS